MSFLLDILMMVPGQTQPNYFLYTSPFMNLSKVLLCSQVVSLRPTDQNSQTLTGEQAILAHAVHAFTGELGKQTFGLSTFSELSAENILERDRKENLGVHLHDFSLLLSFKKLGD